MEKLTINDGPPLGPGPNQQQGPPPLQGPAVPQLPPQMFTTAAQLLDLTDKKLMVALRDGRKLIGVLRSWDQFGNLVLQDTIERLFAKDLYSDVHRGLFVIRGENVVLLGEIDLDKDDYIPEGYKEGSVEEVFELHKQEQAQRMEKEGSKYTKLAALGFEGDAGDNTLL